MIYLYDEISPGLENQIVRKFAKILFLEVFVFGMVTWKGYRI